MWRLPALLIALTVLVACSSAGGTPAALSPEGLSGEGYLAQDIPPCTPVAGATADPCGDAPSISSSATQASSSELGNEPLTIAHYLNGGWSTLVDIHLVIRATYLPDTIRCTVQDMNKRAWRLPTLQERIHPERRGEDEVLNCYADVRVNSYIVGTGPEKLTLMVFRGRMHGIKDARVRTDTEASIVRGGNFLGSLAYVGENGIEGRESIIFIGPSYDYSNEVFQAFAHWGIEQREDGTAIVVHPFRFVWQLQDNYETLYRNKVEFTLPAFTAAAQQAQAARLAAHGGRMGAAADMPMYITDANKLAEFHVQAGNVNHPDGPAVGPPPPCGLAVADQVATPQLMLDCIALLEGKDELRGSGTLNWSTDTVVTSWDGVSTDGGGAGGAGGASAQSGGTATQVTKVELPNKGLTGSIPEELEELDLEVLKLSGNTLTGCIPEALRDVATNDLAQLNLLYCDPGNSPLSAGTPTHDSVPLSWAAVDDTSAYRIEYKKEFWEDRSTEWSEASSEITTTSYTVSGLDCGTDYRFRLSAKGSGTTVAASWSDPSASIGATTGACLPVFSQDAYAFEVAENAGSYAVVGTVAATAPYADAVTYRIIGGNSEGKFSIDANAGFIVVRQKLDYETTSAFALIVEAGDGEGGTANVVVTVTVTDVAE